MALDSEGDEGASAGAAAGAAGGGGRDPESGKGPDSVVSKLTSLSFATGDGPGVGGGGESESSSGKGSVFSNRTWPWPSFATGEPDLAFGSGRVIELRSISLGGFQMPEVSHLMSGKAA
jgi:hypothetical protein